MSTLPPLGEALQSLHLLRPHWLWALMLLPPFFDDSEITRPYFKRLRKIRDELIPGGEHSMGMSDDYEDAIEEGAKMVRVGTAICGERG